MKTWIASLALAMTGVGIKMIYPSFSIVTPSFNQGRFIGRTIESVLAQNISGLEYFVFDGGSGDNTVSVLKQFESRLQWVSERDDGQAHAVNKGLRKASGDIIGWLNSDDVYYPGALAAVQQFFAKHPDVDVVYGKANHIDTDDQVIEAYPTQEWDVQKLKQTCFLCQPAVFFRRSVIERVGGLDEKLNFCMDYEFWLRLGKAGVKFAYLPSILAGSRLHDQTKTLSAPFKAHWEACLMLKEKFGYVPVRWLKSMAVLWVKKNTQLRKPQVRFVLLVGLVMGWFGIRFHLV